MMDFLEQIKPLNWQKDQTTNGCEISSKVGGSPNVCFKVDFEIDFPPELVFDYVKDTEKRVQWDQNYDSLKSVKEYPMNT